MSPSKESNTDESSHTRRRLLKTTGAALAVSGLGTVSVAATSQPTKVVEKIRGTRNEPITGEQIKRQRKKALQKYTKDADGRLVLKEFSDDESNILAYNFVGTQDGLREHVYRYSPDSGEDSIGTSSNENDNKGPASRAHRAADKWITGEPTSDSSKSTEQNVGTLSSFPDWSEWNSAGAHYDVNEKPPYGVVIEDYEFKSDPDTDLMAVRTGVDIEAGFNRRENGYDEYGTWHIKKAKVKQQWKSPLVGDEDMRDRYPRGPLDEGTISKGISLGVDGQGVGSAGVSYSFSKSIDKVFDESSQGDNIGRWRMKLDPHSSAAQSNAYYNPGSLAQVDNNSCSKLMSLPVIDIPLTVEFGQPFYITWSDTHTEDFDTGFNEACY